MLTSTNYKSNLQLKNPLTRYIILLMIIFSFFSLTDCSKTSRSMFKTPKKSLINKKWAHSSPVISEVFNPTDNLPWYADRSSTMTCSASIMDYTTHDINNQARGVLTSVLSGGINDAICYQLNYSNVAVDVSIKIVSFSIVHAIEFAHYCGELMNITPERDDPSKPSITNGISCHCPGSAKSARFSSCKEDIYSLSNMTFSRGFPSSEFPSSARLCHDVEARGNSKGCILSGDGQYFLKFYTDWALHPRFRLRKISYPEIILGVTFNGIYKELPISALDPTAFDFGLDVLTFQSSGIDIPDSSLPLVDIFSFSSNLSDPNLIYFSPVDDFNDDDQNDPHKLCFFQVGQNGYKSLDKNWLSEVFRDDFQSVKCGNNQASGYIQESFPRLNNVAKPENKLQKLLDLNNLSLHPGSTSLLKEKIEGSFTLNVLHNKAPPFIGSRVDACFLNNFDVICKETFNNDPIPCTVTYTTNGPGQVTVLSDDAQYVIATFDVTTLSGAFDILVDQIYSSVDSLSLCSYCTWSSGPPICKSSAVKITTSEDPIADTVAPVNEGSVNTGVIFNDDGSYQSWFIAVIVIASILALVILLVIFYPFIKWIFMRCHNSYKSKKEKFWKMRQQIADSPAVNTDVEKPQELTTFDYNALLKKYEVK